MKKRKTPKRRPVTERWVKDRKVFLDETRRAVLAALTEWRQQYAGRVRNVAVHDVKQEPIDTATSPLWLRLQPTRNTFSLVIDFERLED
jgi:hypothetical protein